MEPIRSEAYNAMLEEMKKGTYTEAPAKKVISNLYIKKMLTDEEYGLLMEEASKLSVNTEEGNVNNRITALDERITSVEKEVQTIKEVIAEGGTDIHEPEPGAEGTKEDPIEAYKGMMYFKDKYCRDPEDSKVYKCFRDSDSEPGSGVRLDYLPHDLKSIYFEEVID